MKGEIIEEERTFTVSVKVVWHPYGDELPGTLWAEVDSVDDAIKVWAWGLPRPGAHGWDTEACHVTTIDGVVWLLYVTEKEDVG